jgi:hypothetical protein
VTLYFWFIVLVYWLQKRRQAGEGPGQAGEGPGQAGERRGHWMQSRG